MGLELLWEENRISAGDPSSMQQAAGLLSADVGVVWPYQRSIVCVACPPVPSSPECGLTIQIPATLGLRKTQQQGTMRIVVV